MWEMAKRLSEKMEKEKAKAVHKSDRENSSEAGELFSASSYFYISILLVGCWTVTNYIFSRCGIISSLIVVTELIIA